MKGRVAIAIDLGGTTLSVALVEQDGRIRASRSTPSDAARGPQPVIEDMVRLADELLTSTDLDRSAVVGVGVGAPGPLDLAAGRIIRAANLPGWIDVPLRTLLADKLEMNVVLDNDGNTAAFGEHWAGAGRGCRDMVMLTLGTGVGAGVVLDGRLLHGHFDNAAELGHTIVTIDGLPCACGQRGCLEQYASAGGVARRAMDAIDHGQSSVLTRDDSVPITAQRVADAARAGDDLCLCIWDEACRALAIACINIQHAYNPERVVLGGGMSDAGDFLLDGVQHHLAAQRWSLHDDVPSLRLAELGHDAGVVGAGGLAWRHGSDE